MLTRREQAMMRGWVLVLGVLVCACAPATAPAPMAATQASEHLERFAAGAAGEEVCTPQGRALLRGAVRAYGAELAQAGVAWPALPEGAEEGLRAVDLAVAIAFAAGLVEPSDFQAAARDAVSRFTSAHWPQLNDMRAAARVACAQAVELQQAALRFAAELERYRRLSARPQGADADAARLHRQRARLARAQGQLNALEEAVQQHIAQARRR